jgi:hypothetical protein
MTIDVSTIDKTYRQYSTSRSDVHIFMSKETTERENILTAEDEN